MTRTAMHPTRTASSTPTGVMTPTLRDYQREAVQFLQDRPRAALFLDMGLGKTAITLSALTPEHFPVLVSAPVRVARSVWPAETSIWRPDLRTVVAEGANREAALNGDIQADIVVISREQLAHAIPHAERFSTFVMDELSSFKNPRAARFKYAKALTKHTPHVWGLTGTPAPNGLLDLWAQMFLIDRGAALDPHITKFRARFFTPGPQLPSGVVTRWDLRPGADAQIHRRLEGTALSMSTDGRVELPPVTVNDVAVPLPSAVRSTYRRLKDELVTDLTDLGMDDGAMFSAANAAVLGGRLAQVASGFLYADERVEGDDTFTELHSEKLRALDEVIDGTGGSPVMVGYAFRAELARLRQRYPEARTPDTAEDIDAWNRGEVPILLVHPASAGHGLNLQHGGHTMVWLTMPWSLEEYQQTNKRLARSGQKHPVVIHRLISPGTVDVARQRVLEGKADVQTALLEHLEMKK